MSSRTSVPMTICAALPVALLRTVDLLDTVNLPARKTAGFLFPPDSVNRAGKDSPEERREIPGKQAHRPWGRQSFSLKQGRPISEGWHGHSRQVPVNVNSNGFPPFPPTPSSKPGTPGFQRWFVSHDPAGLSRPQVPLRTTTARPTGFGYAHRPLRYSNPTPGKQNNPEGNATGKVTAG